MMKGNQDNATIKEQDSSKLAFPYLCWWKSVITSDCFCTNGLLYASIFSEHSTYSNTIPFLRYFYLHSSTLIWYDPFLMSPVIKFCTTFLNCLQVYILRSVVQCASIRSIWEQTSSDLIISLKKFHLRSLSQWISLEVNVRETSLTKMYNVSYREERHHRLGESTYQKKWRD